MKKHSFSLIELLVVGAIVATICIPAIALAGQVYDRTVITVPAAGTGRWTNNATSYSAISLKRFWVENNLFATNVLTFTRVTSDGLYTQAVASITCASGEGNTATFTAGYMAYGDMLDYSSWLGTNTVLMLEYEVQQH